MRTGPPSQVRPPTVDPIADPTTARRSRLSRAERGEAGRRAQRRRSALRLGVVAGGTLAVFGLFAVASGVGQPNVGVAAPNEGGVGVHIPADAALTQRNRPPSSGPHYASKAAYGVFANPVPAGSWVHALEHGGIAVLFKCADPAECATTSNRIRSEVYDRSRNGAFGERKLVITPYQEMDSAIAVVAWGRILELRGIDAEQILAFYDRYLDRGPERAA